MADSVKTVLGDVLRGLKNKDSGCDEDCLRAALRDIIGDKALTHTKIVYLTKGRIRVNVNSSAWLYELTLRKNPILQALKKKLSVTDIAFVLGDI
jgi:hypothetical protein